MENEQTIEDIKQRILECLKEKGIIVKSIILFGSRVRGNFSKYSDYDFLIITEKTLTFKEKMEISKTINQMLAKLLIPSDIIIKSEEEVNYYKRQIGTITREAIKEGVEI